jgi:hypothetical protein
VAFDVGQVDMLIEVEFTSMMRHGICHKVEFVDLFDPNLQ